MNSYLVFTLYGTNYGLDALQVLDVVPLPRLDRTLEAPPYMAGLFNLRGRVVPVVDLALRLGRTPPPYRLEDRVVVFRSPTGDDALMGLIVNETRDILPIAADQLQPPPDYGTAQDNGHFVGATAFVGPDTLLLLDLQDLITQELELDVEGEEEPADAVTDYFFPAATAQQRRVFDERAAALRLQQTEPDQTGYRHCAVFALGDERLAIDIGLVDEFVNIKDITPIPCCPPQVVGALNLRGTVLPILDIRPVLDLPQPPLELPAQALVIRYPGFRAGMLIDTALDIARLRCTALSGEAGARQEKRHIHATAPYGEGVVGILDLEDILRQELLTVDQ